MINHVDDPAQRHLIERRPRSHEPKNDHIATAWVSSRAMMRQRVNSRALLNNLQRVTVDGYARLNRPQGRMVVRREGCFTKHKIDNDDDEV